MQLTLLSTHPLEQPPPGHAQPRSTRQPSTTAASMAGWMVDEAKRRDRARPSDVVFSITLQPGRVVPRTPDFEQSDLHEEKLLKRFSATMDRHHLGYGERFISMKKHRPWYFLIGQHGSGGAHYHGVVSIPAGKVEAFEMHAPWVWKNLTHGGGSLVIKEQLDAGWLDYITRFIGNAPQIIAWHSIP